MANPNEPGKQAETQPAAISNVSLSQVLLAPLDAIFKAQIHAARSFLNMLLQIGYPHRPVGPDGLVKKDDGKAYNQEFYYETEIDGKKETRKVSVPALALIPVAPLAVNSAKFSLALKVSETRAHNQMQASEAGALKDEDTYDQTKRPWFLVTEPISVRGTLAPTATTSGGSQESIIQIEINVERVPMPSGVDKLLTFLTQTSHS